MVVDLAAAVRTAGRATHVFLDRALQMSAWFFAAPPVSLLASTLVTTTLAVSYVCTGLAIVLVWASVIGWFLFGWLLALYLLGLGGGWSIAGLVVLLMLLASWGSVLASARRR